MNQTDVIKLAKRGNPDAIAAVLLHAYGDSAVRVHVGWDHHDLIVQLEATAAPNPQEYVKATRAAVLSLEIPTLHTIQVEGYATGAAEPSWEITVAAAPTHPLRQLWQRLRRARLTPQQRQQWWLGIGLAIATSFMIGIGFSHLIYAQNSTGLDAATDIAAVAPDPATLEPAPPPPAEADETLRSRDLPYFGDALPDAVAAPSPESAATPAEATAETDAAPADPPAAVAIAPAEPAPRSTASAAPAASPADDLPNLGTAGAVPKAPPAPEITTSSTPGENLVIKAVGDIIPGTNFPSNRLPSSMDILFRDVRPYLAETDLLFGNFESTLTDYPTSAKDVSQGMTFAFRTPPHYAGLLKSVGFDVLSVANNHSWDFHEQGFNDTIKHIEQAGMQATGRRGEITYTEANGIKVAFIGFSYFPDHNSMNELGRSANLVQEAHQNADVVVVSVHAGAEGTDAIHTYDRTEYFYSENRGNMVLFSRAMIDAGADLILGHGPHVPRALELYKDRLIAYSLGNFLGYRTLSTVGALGNSLILQTQLAPDGSFQVGRIIPVVLDDNGVPRIDDYFRTVALMRDLTRSDFPNTPLLIDGEGYIRKTG